MRVVHHSSFLLSMYARNTVPAKSVTGACTAARIAAISNPGRAFPTANHIDHRDTSKVIKIAVAKTAMRTGCLATSFAPATAAAVIVAVQVIECFHKKSTQVAPRTWLHRYTSQPAASPPLSFAFSLDRAVALAAFIFCRLHHGNDALQDRLAICYAIRRSDLSDRDTAQKLVCVIRPVELGVFKLWNIEE